MLYTSFLINKYRTLLKRNYKMKKTSLTKYGTEKKYILTVNGKTEVFHLNWYSNSYIMLKNKDLNTLFVLLLIKVEYKHYKRWVFKSLKSFKIIEILNLVKSLFIETYLNASQMFIAHLCFLNYKTGKCNTTWKYLT